MSEKQNEAQKIDVPAQVSPPTASFGHFALGVTPSEVLLTFGTTRTLVTSPASIQQGVEWVITGALSPVLAAQLVTALSEALKIYEKMYGKIPLDPNLKLTIAGVTTDESKK